MTKTLTKILICTGFMIGFAEQGFAQSASMQALARSSFANKTLGLRTGATQGELLAKIATLPQAQQNALYAALSLANANLKAETGTNVAQIAAAKKANDQTIAGIFTVNNEPLKLADLTAKYASRASTDAAANKGITSVSTQINFVPQNSSTCNVTVYGTKLADGTRYSVPEVTELVSKGYITMGSCNAQEGGLLAYSADARGTLVNAMSAVARFAGSTSVSQMSAEIRKQIGQSILPKALADAKNLGNPAKPYTEESERITAAKIYRDCGLVPFAP